MKKKNKLTKPDEDIELLLHDPQFSGHPKEFLAHQTVRNSSDDIFKK